jgi:undecaprenyl pyrophosphate synthase
MNSLNKLTAGSLNTSVKNNFSLCNLYSNDFSYDNLEKEKYDIQKQLNDNQMKKINNQIKKTQSFIYKIYNYFIKQPKIEVCHFIKIDKRVKNINNKLNTSSEKSFKAKKLNLNINVNTNNTKRTSSLVKEIFTSGNNNNYEEEKINENSQNGFLVTFGEANSNKKNIEIISIISIILVEIILKV